MSSSLLKIKIPSQDMVMETKQQKSRKGRMMSLQDMETQQQQTQQQQSQQQQSRKGRMMSSQYDDTPPTTPPFPRIIGIPQQQRKQGRMMSSQYDDTPPPTPPFPRIIGIPHGQMMRMSPPPTTPTKPPTTPTTPTTPAYPYPKKLLFSRGQMDSQDMKTPPNPKKVKFDASLLQDQTKKTKTRLKRHAMSLDDKSNFYSKSNIKKMNVESRNAVPAMIQFFKSYLDTIYKKPEVRKIMSALKAKMELIVKTKRDEVFNLDLQQARKYFLEEIIMEEMQNMASGKPLTLLPTASPIYPNHVTIKNLLNENIYIPIEEGVTYGMIKIIYASLIGIDNPSRIIFLKDGNLLQDTYYTEPCVIDAMVK